MDSTITIDEGTEVVSLPFALKETQRFISPPNFTPRHTATPFCELQTHSHSAFTVTAVLVGEMLVTIGENVFELSAGHTALTNVDQRHSARGAEVEFVSIGLSP